MTTNKFSGHVSSRRTRIVDRAWLYFLFGLALLMGALLIGPRVADQDQQSICVGNIDLLGPFGFSLNCDSPQFMALARDPSALLEPKNARQARPGLILAAALIQAPLSLVVSSNGLPARSIENGLEDTTEIVRSFDRDLPAYLAYIALNIAILLAAFFVLRLIVRPWVSHDGATSIIIAASGLVLIANDVVKAFVWSPHTQMFNILVPVLALYATLRAWGGAMLNRRFTLAMAALVGLGFTAYPLFVVIPACIVPVAIAVMVRDRSVGAPVLTNLALLLVLSAIPSMLWYFYVRSVTGSFFQAEIALGQVVWMAESWSEGATVFLIDWFDTAWQLIELAAPQLLAVAALSGWVILWAAFGQFAKADLQSVAPVIIAALYVSVAVLVFYTCVGWLNDRLAYAIIPSFLAAAASGAVVVLHRMGTPRRIAFAAGCAIIAIAQLIFVAGKDGPWS
jgi:hypothetical protein